MLNFEFYHVLLSGKQNKPGLCITLLAFGSMKKSCYASVSEINREMCVRGGLSVSKYILDEEWELLETLMLVNLVLCVNPGIFLEHT